MTMIINEFERGFLFKDGLYCKMLLPGKHKVRTTQKEIYFRVNVSKAVSIPNIDIALLLKDKEFAGSVSRIDVPNGYIAIHTEDKLITDVLQPGTYCFWNCFRQHDFKLIDISHEDMSDLTMGEIMAIPQNTYLKASVPEGQVGILFFDGQFQRVLQSGIYYFWKNMKKVSCQLVETRSQQVDISGQEILTSDRISLRLNFTCTYKITDPLKAVTEVKDHSAQIHTLTQLALREYVGRFRFDELLAQKDSIAAFVLEQLQAKQDSLFVKFSDAGIKDIILPGEIRDIMNTVLVAEKNAQANVIARREEVASTRSLLNTAKLMDENATLYKLKELEYLEKICDRVGNISIGGGNLLADLQAIVSTRSSS